MVLDGGAGLDRLPSASVNHYQNQVHLVGSVVLAYPPSVVAGSFASAVPRVVKVGPARGYPREMDCVVDLPL